MIKQRKPENLVMEAVGEYLTLRRFFFFRVNNIPVFNPVTRVFRSMPKYSMHGVSDFIALKDGVAYFIECKAPKGKASEAQQLFKANVEAQGGVYLLVRGVDDLVTQLGNKKPPVVGQ